MLANMGTSLRHPGLDPTGTSKTRFKDVRGRQSYVEHLLTLPFDTTEYVTVLLTTIHVCLTPLVTGRQ